MNYGRRNALLVVVALLGLSALALGASASPSGAAADSTPPVIQTNLNTGFVVGSVVQQGTPDWNYSAVQEFIKWTVSDNSAAICGFEVNTVTGDDVERVIADPVQRYTPTPYVDQLVVVADEYSGQEGDSEDAQAGWSLEATDCANNATKRMIRSKFELLEENNFSEFEGARGSITYNGTWSSVTCACASQAAMKKTSAKGASFTYTDYWNRDDHLGLVMAKGPSRGSADVYVDGVKVATVNTYSTTVQNRVIVYDRWMAEGTHTVKVVNLATSGHGRIDLDAVLNS